MSLNVLVHVIVKLLPTKKGLTDSSENLCTCVIDLAYMRERVVVVITLIAVAAVLASPVIANPGYAATSLRVNNKSDAFEQFAVSQNPAAPTTGVVPAAADEVSAATAALFAAHAQEYQAISAQAAAFHNQFVQALQAGASSVPSSKSVQVK